MPETPETHERIAKMQKDIEELKEEIQNAWHLNKERYQKRVKDVLQGDFTCIALYLEIDGIRSIKEIEDGLVSSGHNVPHVTLWRASRRLLKDGLIKKVGVKSRSPIYTKKPWALALGLDDYVREKIIQKENKSKT